MSDEEVKAESEDTDLDRKVNGVVGGLLLIWAGIALQAEFGWGVALIGVGIILLAEQAARRHFGVDFDWFWVGVGIVSAGSGVGMLFGLKVSLVPILLIIVGIALIASAVSSKEDES